MSLADHKGIQRGSLGTQITYAFSVLVVKLYGFCLSIAYIARQRHPYIESLPTL